jgi:hypothetical protein
MGTLGRNNIGWPHQPSQRASWFSKLLNSVCNWYQGTLTEGKAQYGWPPRQGCLLCIRGKQIFSMLKAHNLNKYVQEINCNEPSLHQGFPAGIVTRSSRTEGNRSRRIELTESWNVELHVQDRERALGYIRNTLFYSKHMNGSKKLECLSLQNLSSLV